MARKISNLNSINNSKCLKNCNRDDRSEITDEDLCKIAPSMLDGLPVRCVGDWAYEKIFRITSYFNIFSVGMKDKWTSGLNYIEICSGPGRCNLRESGLEVDGTSLSIVCHPAFQHIRSATFIDYNERVVEILNHRIKALGRQSTAKAVLGDYSDLSNIKDILKDLPQNCLNLVFIDPTDCSIPFQLIEVIKTNLTNADFIINVALGTDLNRNLRPAILDQSFSKAKEKYSSFLGEKGILNEPEFTILARTGSDNNLKMAYLNRYKQKLAHIGLKHMDEVTVKHFYILLFASQDERGLDFWKKAAKTEPSGQIGFGF